MSPTRTFWTYFSIVAIVLALAFNLSSSARALPSHGTVGGIMVYGNAIPAVEGLQQPPPLPTVETKPAFEPPQPGYTPNLGVAIRCVYYRYKDHLTQFPTMDVHGLHVAAVETLVGGTTPDRLFDNGLFGNCDTFYDGERFGDPAHPTILTKAQVWQLHVYWLIHHPGPKMP